MKKLLILCCTSLILSACVEPIDLNLNRGDNLKLVVDAWLDNTDRDQVVKLSLTTDYFDETTPTEATGAEIRLVSSEATYSFTEIEAGKYRMNGRITEEFGTLFELIIDYEDVEYSATHALNRVPEAEYLVRFYGQEEDEDLPIYDFFINVTEPAGEGDNYYFNTFLKGEEPEINLSNDGITSDEFIDGSEVNEAYVADGLYSPGDTVIIQMRSISKEALTYIEDIVAQTLDRGFIFDTPPANVPSNLSGGARGFFILSAVDEGEVVCR